MVPADNRHELEETMPTAQPAIFATMGKNQWYVHLSRTEGADLDHIKAVLRELRADCASNGINLVVGFGPDPPARPDERHARGLPAVRHDRSGRRLRPAGQGHPGGAAPVAQPRRQGQRVAGAVQGPDGPGRSHERGPGDPDVHLRRLAGHDWIHRRHRKSPGASRPRRPRP